MPEPDNMLIHSVKPIDFNNRRVQIPLRAEDLRDENVFEEVWHPWEDNPENDIYRLMEQNRL